MSEQQITRELLTKRFLTVLESEKPLSWIKGWETREPVRNGVSGRRYRGVNQMYLQLIADEKGYNDPRWCTYKQAAENGWQVKKGEHGEKVEYWFLFDQKEKKSWTFEEARKIIKLDPGREKDLRLTVKHFTVFNGEQIEGIPAYEIKTTRFRKDAVAEKFLARLSAGMDVPVIYGGDEAYYSPSTDRVYLPAPENFFSTEAYYSTALHEFGHATGHASRLNRELQNAFGDEKYATEELRAEIASTFLAAETGIPVTGQHMENHLAYVKSWVSSIREKPETLFRAIKDAEQISDYMVEKGELQECIKEAELETEKEGEIKLESQEQTASYINRKYGLDHEKEEWSFVQRRLQNKPDTRREWRIGLEQEEEYGR